MPCYAIDGLSPVVDPTAYVHPDAVLIGDVIVGPGCYVGPLASLRGDFGRIELQAGSNVQDACVLHTFPGGDAIVEPDGHVGHGAVLHGCCVGRDAMVGMLAVVMDGAVIGAEAVVGAGAFVPAGFAVPPRGLAVGAPVRILRTLGDDDVARKQAGTAAYQQLTRRCLATLVAVEPLRALAPDRPRLALRPLPMPGKGR